jgi:hypothetical protein
MILRVVKFLTLQEYDVMRILYPILEYVPRTNVRRILLASDRLSTRTIKRVKKMYNIIATSQQAKQLRRVTAGAMKVSSTIVGSSRARRLVLQNTPLCE